MSVAQILIQDMQEVFMDCLFTDRYILYKLPRCMKTKVKGTHADINIERTTRTGISFSTSQVFQVRYTRPFAFRRKLSNSGIISVAHILATNVQWRKVCFIENMFDLHCHWKRRRSLECQTDQALLAAIKSARPSQTPTWTDPKAFLPQAQASVT